MAWYHKVFGLEDTSETASFSSAYEKLNPSQDIIRDTQGHDISSSTPLRTYTSYYESLEAVNRAINMVVDDSAAIPYEVGDTWKVPGTIGGVKGITVNALMNIRPNPWQDINTFRRNCIIDLILDGNIFIYFDGDYLYHLPATLVTIKPDPVTYVKEYVFNGRESYKPTSIIHIKENSFNSIYRGVSRLKSALDSMSRTKNMSDFQSKFFENGAVVGLILKTESVLSDKIKERMLQTWMTKYKPNGGGRRPIILDGGMQAETLNDISFREMAFEESIEASEKRILKAIGVPPILLDSGNNANLRPNHRLYYLETIIPILQKISAAYSKFFGFTIKEDVTNVPALQPEMNEQGSYYQALVNGGILTPNEARDNLGYDPKPESDDLRIPANIAGSAVDPNQGGRPPNSKE